MVSSMSELTELGLSDKKLNFVYVSAIYIYISPQK